MIIDDKDFLQWVHDRLVLVHGENENYDYMYRLRAIIELTPKGQMSKALGVHTTERKLL